MVMKVAVVGLGTVGETVASVLNELRPHLPLSELILVRRAVPEWDRPRMADWASRGATIVTHTSDDGYEDFASAAERIEFVFDCGPNGHATGQRPLYEKMPHLVGAVAQGSESTFGAPFMTGVPESRITNARFVHVVSCNTHGIASVLQALGGDRLEAIESADFVIVRRSEDIGKSERLVGANVVARHRDPIRGTHHAHDVARLFAEIGVVRDPVSSDVTTPSQLLHSLRFRVRTTKDVDPETAFSRRLWLATTGRFDSDAVFERGRRAGFEGRVWAHAVIVSNNLMIREREIIGWALIPQEANSIPSTIHAWLLQVGAPDPESTLERLRERVFVGQL